MVLKNMSKTSFFIITIISCLIVSCTKKVDFSNPKSVVEEYYSLYLQDKYKSAYELIADTCKEYVTLEEYIEYNKPSTDSSSTEYDYNVKNINQLTLNPLYPKYRGYEIEVETIEKPGNDTTIYYNYFTVYNENEKWKLIWTANMYKAARKLMNSQRFSEAIQAYKQILQYDPLNGNAYHDIGRCQFRQHYLEKALINANYALELAPKNKSNYNLLAGIYGSQNNHELAIKNYKKAIEMCSTDKEKVTFLSNMTIDYLAIGKWKEALEAVNQALAIDSTFTHAWWMKGEVYLNKQNLDSALICLRKATQLEPLDDYIKEQLFFYLAYTEYTKAISKTTSSDNKVELLKSAKEHILKALDLEHDNYEYKKLLNKINRAVK